MSAATIAGILTFGRSAGAYAFCSPGQLRGGSGTATEAGRFLFTLPGCSAWISDSDAEMLAFAESLPTADIAEVIRSRSLSTNPSKCATGQVCATATRTSTIIDGFLVVGDACAAQPVYAQGMTVAALEALLLRKLLADGTRDLPRRFFRAAAKVINIPCSWPWRRFCGFRKSKSTASDDRLITSTARYRAAARSTPGSGPRSSEGQPARPARPAPLAWSRNPRAPVGEESGKGGLGYLGSLATVEVVETRVSIRTRRDPKGPDGALLLVAGR